jgi:lysophospholipase L1-like esterase
MKMKNLKKLLYIAPLVFAFGCEPEFDEEFTFVPGNADFSNYVAVGNSLTAGYQNSALSADGQLNSFPAILSGQMKLAGGGEHKVPLLEGKYGQMGAGIVQTTLQNGVDTTVVVPELELANVTDCKNKTSLGPALSGPSLGFVPEFLTTSNATPGPYNNYGVPGAKAIHLNFPGYGKVENLATSPPTANPFYVRFTDQTNPNTTVVQAALTANPTFFSLWIGNNDVLGYALAGGSSDAITPPTQFNQAYNATVSQLVANGAKGIVANIPDITSIPHFTTIPTKTTLTQAQADALNGAYAAYNAGVQSAADRGVIQQQAANFRKIQFSAGDNNYFVVKNDDLGNISNGQGGFLPKYRQIKPNELLVLTTPTDSIKCFGLGTQAPMQDKYHLDRNELSAIKDAVTSYNATIKQAADANGLAFVDANKLLSEMENGLTFNGVTYSTEFVSGGAFSLDGVHPNTVGYAIIANAHIDAINSTYGASIPRVNVNEYEGVVFP